MGDARELGGRVCGVVRPRLHCGLRKARGDHPADLVCGVVRPRLHCGSLQPDHSVPLRPGLRGRKAPPPLRPAGTGALSELLSGLRGRKAPPPLRQYLSVHVPSSQTSLRGRKAPPPLRRPLAAFNAVIMLRLRGRKAPPPLRHVPSSQTKGPRIVCGVVRPRLHCGSSAVISLGLIFRVCGLRGRKAPPPLRQGRTQANVLRQGTFAGS